MYDEDEWDGKMEISFAFKYRGLYQIPFVDFMQLQHGDYTLTLMSESDRSDEKVTVYPFSENRFLSEILEDEEETDSVSDLTKLGLYIDCKITSWVPCSNKENKILQKKLQGIVPKAKNKVFGFAVLVKSGLENTEREKDTMYAIPVLTEGNFKIVY